MSRPPNGREDPRVIPFRRPSPPPKPPFDWQPSVKVFLGLFVAALIAVTLFGGLPDRRELIICLVFALVIALGVVAGQRHGGGR